MPSINEIHDEKIAQELSEQVCLKLQPEGYYKDPSILVGLSIYEDSKKSTKGQTWLHQDNGSCFALAIKNGLSVLVDDQSVKVHKGSKKMSERIFSEKETDVQSIANMVILEALTKIEN